MDRNVEQGSGDRIFIKAGLNLSKWVFRC